MLQSVFTGRAQEAYSSLLLIIRARIHKDSKNPLRELLI